MNTKATVWTCALCGWEEPVYKTTDGDSFVLHTCPTFSWQKSKELGVFMEEFVVGGIHITYFPAVKK